MNFSDMAPARSDSVKQAALLVHSMEGADREWLWSHLPAMQQEELKRLIAELDELGIAKDRQALSSRLAEDGGRLEPTGSVHLPGQHEASAETNPTLSDVDFLCALNSDRLDALARIWGAEPPQFVVVALNAHDWPWRTSLLERLPVVPRRRIEDLLSTPGLLGAPSLVKAVLQATRANLMQEHPEAIAAIHSGHDPYGSGFSDTHGPRHAAHGLRGRTVGPAQPRWMTRVVEAVRVPWRRLFSSRMKGDQ
jgi:hypothetical protein